jgi:hypothetical protein
MSRSEACEVPKEDLHPPAALKTQDVRVHCAALALGCTGGHPSGRHYRGLPAALALRTGAGKSGDLLSSDIREPGLPEDRLLNDGQALGHPGQPRRPETVRGRACRWAR